MRRARNDEVAAGEIDIEIFDLGAPVRRKAELGADARRPADIAAEIGTGPAIGVERLVDRVGRAAAVVEVGGLRACAPAGGDQRQRARHEPGHRYTPPTPLTATAGSPSPAWLRNSSLFG